MMESPDHVLPLHVDSSSRPSLGFPLGTVLLLIIIFSLSGIFSCCYHWEKLRALRQSFSGESTIDAEAHVQSSPSKPKFHSKDGMQHERKCLPVLMPGDEIPRFIALPCPCPCEASRPEKIFVKVEKPPEPTSLPVPLD